jgi:glycerol kinase
MGKRYILAIDPGTTQSAFVFWDADKKIILNKGIRSNEEMIKIIADTNFDSLVIEMVASYGMPVGKDVFETCVWVGRFVQAKNPDKSHLLYRREVKLFLCGNLRAKDGNIRQALIDMLGKDVTKGVSKDVWAALGVAITYADKVQRETDGETVKEVGI